MINKMIREPSPDPGEILMIPEATPVENGLTVDAKS